MAEMAGFNELVVTKTFTEKQKAFIDHVSRGCDLAASATYAGYEHKSARTIAYHLMREPAILAAVQIGVARELARSAPIALRVLNEFTADVTVDKRLRYACAKTLLDRAGHIAPRAQAPANAHETPLNELSTTELRALADRLEGELSGRAKDVSSAKPAPRKAQTIDDIM